MILGKLTAKQEAFAQAVADGMSQANAYRTAYDASRMKDATIYSKASILMEDGKVRARLDELRSKLTTKALWTREMSVKALVGAYKEGNASAKVAAVKELNAMHGFNAPGQLEISNPDGSMRPTVIKIIAG